MGFGLPQPRRRGPVGYSRNPAFRMKKPDSAILIGTLLPRFASHAVVLQLDQIHLRLSCPPFQFSAKSKINVSGTKVLHVYLSV